MAEEKNNPAFIPEIGDPGEGETDVLFRAQMGAYNFFAGYWRQLLGILGAFLLVTLVYSLYMDRVRSTQRDLQAQISEIDRLMPEEDPMAMMMGGSEPDEEMLANLREGARRYTVVAEAGNGTAAVMAWQRASDALDRAGDTEEAIAALQAAHDRKPDGLLGWSVAARLGALKANSGDVDGAIQLFQEFSVGEDFIAQHATLELGLMLESAERDDEASTTLNDFLARFPESPLAPQASEALLRLQG